MSYCNSRYTAVALNLCSSPLFLLLSSPGQRYDFYRKANILCRWFNIVCISMGTKACVTAADLLHSDENAALTYLS